MPQHVSKFKLAIAICEKKLKDFFRPEEEKMQILIFKSGLEDGKFLGQSGKYIVISNGELIPKFFDRINDIVDNHFYTNAIIFQIPPEDE